MGTFSKIGFILSVAGSAVGLGNAWKFPYVVGENGGGAFVLLYLLITIFISVPIFLAEVTIGKLGKSDPVSSYENLAPTNSKHLWKYVGFSFIGALLIASFYNVIIGWIIRYIFLSFNLPNSSLASSKFFNNFVGYDIKSQILYFSISFLFCLYIVSKGIKAGIERLNIIMMPSLSILLIIMFLFSLDMDSFLKACKFLLYPDFSKLNIHSFLNALGISFFTLSIGIGIIITYSASLNDNTNIVKSSIYIVCISLIMSLLIGIIVFTFVFKFNLNPQEGSGLVFKTLPMLFFQMGAIGKFLSFLFFISLFFAGMTSAVSIIEPSISYFTNRLKISRKKSLFIIGSFVYVLGIICILSQSKEFKHTLTFFNTSFFNILDFISSNLIMPISGFMASIFIGYVINKDVIKEFLLKYFSERYFMVWVFILKTIAPIAIFLILIKNIF